MLCAGGIAPRWPAPELLFTQKSQAFASVSRLRCPVPGVSYSVPPGATRSGKSARPDSSRPGWGSTNKVNRYPVAHMDKSHQMDTSHHRDKSNRMGSIPDRKLLAHR